MGFMVIHSRKGIPMDISFQSENGLIIPITIQNGFIQLTSALMHGIIPPEAWRKIGFDPSKHTLYGGVLKWRSPKPIGCFNLFKVMKMARII